MSSSSTLSDGRIRVKSDNSNFYNRDYNCTSQNFYRGDRLGCLNSGYGAGHNAFLETICICSEKFSSLSIIIPKSLSRCDLDLYTDMLPIVLSHGIIRYIRRMSQCQCVITLHLSKLNNSFHLVDHVTKISISDCNC